MSSSLRSPIRSLAVLLALVVAIGATGCAKKTDTATTETIPPAAEPTTPTLTDANIAAVVVAANDIDIKTSGMAKSTSKNADVKAFADQMVTDHTAVNKQATDLVTRLNVTPEDNDLSRQFIANGDATREQIKAKTGAEFDRAYIDNEVAYHEALMNVLDNTLIPSAQNAELKALLESVRPAFVAHLDHARQVQSKLNTPQ